MAPFLMTIVIGGIGYALVQHPKAAPSSVKTVTNATASEPTPTTPVVASSTVRVLIGAAAPSASTDLLYELTLPDKKIVAKTANAGWRVGVLNDPKHGIQIVPKTGSDASVLSGTGWNVVLRDKKGVAYTDVRLLGFFDQRHAAVLGRKETVSLLSVNTNGEISPLYPVHETTNPLGFFDGAVWFSTFRPGEGIESAPTGPSSLIRVHGDGATSTLMISPAVIVQIVPGPEGSNAVLTDDGTLTMKTTDQSKETEGKPLLWINKTQLLYAKGATLFVWDAEKGTTDSLGLLPHEPTTAVLAPERS